MLDVNIYLEETAPKESLESLLKNKKINLSTYNKVISAKSYISKKFSRLKLEELEKEVINLKLQNAELTKSKISQVEHSMNKDEMERKRKALKKQTVYNYKHIKKIGQGTFGEVHLCMNNETGEFVAIKKFSKDKISSMNQIVNTKNEQYFLSKQNSPWIVDLKASFQEGEFLFFVLEYCPGGDLNHLISEDEPIKEENAKFYMAELVLALESLHSFKCIHRDIKPENILIAKDGHIKLSDFGLSKVSDNYFVEDNLNFGKNKNNNNNKEFNDINGEFDENDKKLKNKKSFTCVGTPYYVAIEVLMNKGYTKSVDWWSAGVVLFEMLYGYTPFYGQDIQTVGNKILNFKKYLKFPSKIKVSSSAKDLIKRLVTIQEQRLDNPNEIKKHPFFKGIIWNKIKEMTPPFIPNVSKIYDNSNFNDFSGYNSKNFYPEKTDKKKDSEYIGITFNGEEARNPNYLENFLVLLNKAKTEIKERDKLSKENRAQLMSSKYIQNNAQIIEEKTETNMESDDEDEESQKKSETLSKHNDTGHDQECAPSVICHNDFNNFKLNKNQDKGIKIDEEFEDDFLSRESSNYLFNNIKNKDNFIQSSSDNSNQNKKKDTRHLLNFNAHSKKHS